MRNHKLTTRYSVTQEVFVFYPHKKNLGILDYINEGVNYWGVE